MPRATLVPLICLLIVSAVLAERYTDQPSALQIEVPEKWKLDEGRKHTTITSPDATVTMLIVSMRHFTSADDCINKLDRDDVMGGRIKSVETQGEPETKKINTLDAKLYKGRFNFANERRQFRALVILVPNDVAYVAFVFGDKDALKQHEATVTKAFETIRKRPD